MNDTVITKQIDDLGRIVLPKEIRKRVGIQIRSDVEVRVEGEKIVLTKAQNECIFCGLHKDLKEFMKGSKISYKIDIIDIEIDRKIERENMKLIDYSDVEIRSLWNDYADTRNKVLKKTANNKLKNFYFTRKIFQVESLLRLEIQKLKIFLIYP